MTSGPIGPHCFASCDADAIGILENVLECPGKLSGGQPDDFLTMYMLFYEQYRGTSTSRFDDDDQMSFPFETKAVVFDFDGTLTARADDETTWEKIWVKLGYSINDCSDLHWKYSNGRFSHQRWCEITRDNFRGAGFSKKDLLEVARSIKLIDGVRETLDALRNRGIKLYILSGSIRQIINEVLGDLRRYFDDIKANDIYFDYNGLIKDIRGTRYDFEGKATFLSRVIEENSYAPYDVLFVGNSCNDIFASRSGARTLCVNPRGTEWNNKEHWTYLLRRMDSLEQILKFVSL
jgi:HAD superfamily phosphoserine phosphatase-like hydrolase